MFSKKNNMFVRLVCEEVRTKQKAFQGLCTNLERMHPGWPTWSPPWLDWPSMPPYLLSAELMKAGLLGATSEARVQLRQSKSVLRQIIGENHNEGCQTANKSRTSLRRWHRQAWISWCSRSFIKLPYKRAAITRWHAARHYVWAIMHADRCSSYHCLLLGLHFPFLGWGAG